MIEQAIDAAYEIDEIVSRSYAFSDCVLAILDFARETHNEATLERVESLLEQVANKGAYTRSLSYFAVALAFFGYEERAEETILKAIKTAALIRDDFDRRDALLDIATSAGDISFLLTDRNMIEKALSFSEQLTEGQKAYLFGYLSTLVSEDESTILMQNALEIAEQIDDPITRSKVFLELSNLLSGPEEKSEEEEDM
ncbi:MAG: hypothetical protein JXA54_16850 [Candidatus Heimdallarchaeota archaeon]|nr:hypothetical protein [Candidatus Heimdallarchaeota archaeon]